jgi:hypothetical protein
VNLRWVVLLEVGRQRKLEDVVVDIVDRQDGHECHHSASRFCATRTGVDQQDNHIFLDIPAVVVVLNLLAAFAPT